MRVIRCDGSPAAAATLRAALGEVLAGGESIAPVGPGDAAPEHDVDAGQVVVSTSGSTGEPKRVLLPARALRASAHASHLRLGGPGSWLLALPTQHIAGLQVLTRAVVAGTETEIVDLRQRFDPASFTAAAQRLVERCGQRTERCYTALVPAQLARLLDADEPTLSAVDAVLLGGGAAPAGLLQRARRAGVAVVTTYGMTETGGGCVYDGRPLDGVRVRTDRHGRVALTGPVLATGYLGYQEQEPAQTGDDAFSGGWFRTSDLGSLHPDGTLQILGRADDVIVTGGVNVAPAEVEAALAIQAGVSTACVVGLPHPRWGQQVVAAVVPVDPSHPPDPATVLAGIRPQLTGPQTPKAVLLMDSLPLRGIGKPDRAAVADYLARRLR